ncbi:acyl-CoA thioesterase [Ferrimonas lipolytica]|uniref:Acyl-CoA thioesterase n=1 Tax=Ferrimonas lipolytica TaxID=2724191 RepID=A0A6H1UKB1_9GAMM|nr:thioesterase family protein [Ferrimonas lipolytica]QIZ78242.1 acyl-CoA thioesterase [Ferrimonas lipolytica]
MFELQLTPRFMETDALGHINNTVIPVWFEEGRTPIFELFVPTLDLKRWNLILAKISVDFVAQIYYGSPVLIQTSISKIGNSSFEVAQQVVQDDKVVAQGLAVMVHFDYEHQRAAPIPTDIRTKMTEHLQLA